MKSRISALDFPAIYQDKQMPYRSGDLVESIAFLSEKCVFPRAKAKYEDRAESYTNHEPLAN
jgi:hypothetical protein